RPIISSPHALHPLALHSFPTRRSSDLARGFISDLPILLLDEPTASLDAANRAVVVELVGQKKREGVAMVAIVHDDEIRHLIADRSEEHTSELQSRENLVCRLLLEKKNK